MASNNQKIITTAIAGLSPRQREVLAARFGLEKGNGETLAAIGERMRITRERVRQIENAGLRVAKENLSKNSEAMALVDDIKKRIVSNGGVMKKEDMVRSTSDLSGNQLDFLSEASGVFSLFPENDDYTSFYFISDADLKRVFAFVAGWVKHLKSRKQKVLKETYRFQLASFMKGEHIERRIADAYLDISKRIHSNSYGDTGLREWPEINPATVRDKIYLVLKKKGAPLHFADIANHINLAKFDESKALVATVHNELIKDSRFSLVGRGMYGLKEDGFEPGTARDVITTVLKRKGPLHPEHVVAQVGNGHFFKRNTILINLQNRNFFERLPNGTYRVRES